MTFINQLKEATKALHWTEKTGLFSLTMMLFAIPIDTGISLAFSCLWVLSVVLKNSLLKRWSFFKWHQDKTYVTTKCGILMLPMLFYWVFYFISLLWTENRVEGWANVGLITWFAVFALTYYCTDFRAVKIIHVRGIVWLYVMCLLGLFVVLLVKGLLSPHRLSIYTIGQPFYDYMHHGYLAVYILMGISFLYTELDRVEGGENRTRKRWLTGLCLAILLAFLFLVNSRTGTLGLLLLLALCWLHQTLVRKHRRLAIVTLVLAPIVLLVIHFSLPDGFHRISSTYEEANQGMEDARITLIKQSWPVIKDHIVLGVGVGDQKAMLAPQRGLTFEEQDEVLNTHNQYLDSWLAAGLPALVALLAMMIVPMCYAWRRKNFFMFSFILIFAVSILFESMFERQMGVVFFGVMMLIFAIELEAEDACGLI